MKMFRYLNGFVNVVSNVGSVVLVRITSLL